VVNSENSNPAKKMRANLPAASGQIICPRAKKKDSLNNIMSECKLFTSQTFWGELYSVSLKFASREFLSFTATTHIGKSTPVHVFWRTVVRSIM
jgi:hypothetical protein